MSELNTQQMQRALITLRRLPPRERLRVIAQALPEAERELETPALPLASSEWDEASLATAETQFKQQLVDMGLLMEIKDPHHYPLHADRTPPVSVEGTPLSEMIIAERR